MTRTAGSAVPPPVSAATVVDAENGVSAALQKLTALRDAGALSDEEFVAARARLLT